MVKEGFRENIRNREAEGRESAVAPDCSAPEHCAVVEDNPDFPVKQPNRLDVPDNEPTEKNDNRWPSGVSAAQPNKRKKRKRNAGSPPQPIVKSKTIRDVENQLKNAILIAKERELKKEFNDATGVLQEDHGKGLSLSQKKMRVKPRLVLLLASDSVEAECFKLLQTLLFFSSDRKVRRPILITSALPGELLLVDCDLKSPALGELFEIDRISGLSDYFTSGVPLSGKIHKTGMEGLSVLSDWRDPENSVSSPCLSETKALLAEWIECFDERTAIFFPAPFSFPSEKSDQAALTDDVLFVIDYGVMPRESSDELVERIGHDKVLRRVVTGKKNDMPPCDKKYTYGPSGRPV